MDYIKLQYLQNKGWGKGAAHVGQPFSAYRVGASSSGNVIQAGNQLTAALPVYRTKLKPGDPAFETDNTQGTYWFSIEANLTGYQVGDVFVLNDSVYGAGYTSVNYETNEFEAFCLAGLRPGYTAIGARIDRNITVLRPNDSPDSTGYFKATLDNALPVVLNNGQFSIGDVGAKAAQIPAGFMPIPRPHGGAIFDATPNIPPHTLWRMYVIPLPGFTFREGDRIVGPDESRYVVLNPYRQEAGLVGSQLIIEREIAQP